MKRFSLPAILLMGSCLLSAVCVLSRAQAAWPPAIPSQAWIDVVNESPYARQAEVVSVGMPLPRNLDIRDTTRLRIRDANQQLVPASFRVLARWHADRNADQAPIRWVLLRFPATLAANSSLRFRLQINAPIQTPNPAPTAPIVIGESATQFDIDTGAGRFLIDRLSGRLIQAGLNDGTTLVQGASLTARIGSEDGSPRILRRLGWEQRDRLSATLIAEYQFDHTESDGPIAGGARYQFQAGSSAVTVREWIDWEGARCSLGELSCAGIVNARQLQRWRQEFSLASANANALVGYQAITAGQPSFFDASSELALQQRRRLRRIDPPRFDVLVNANTAISGLRADAPIVLWSSAAGAVAISLPNMADYEPQALNFLPAAAGLRPRLQVHMANEAVWLGARQGSFAEYRIGVYPSSTSTAEIKSAQLGTLQTPLIGLPEAVWMAASEAVDEIPTQAFPSSDPRVSQLDQRLATLMRRTGELRQSLGLAGLQTHGLFPRNWGDPVLSDEIDCGADPTPNFDWDNTYWCATWTDYHNASAISNVAAWRLRKPSYLHQISTPAALRSFHTQMLRCDEDDPLFYCGQFPTGYGGYRADFNSSHQYVENLIQYYWRSGDETVPIRLEQGARNYRAYLCTSRVVLGGALGPVCAATTPISDSFAGVNDRVANQFYEIFQFLGSTVDSSFLEDWGSNSARAVTQNLALARPPNAPLSQQLAVISPSGQGGTAVITAPGRYLSTQLWMAALYDWNQLHRWQVSSQNQSLGIPLLAPDALIQANGYTLLRTALTPPGNGQASGVWPNQIYLGFTGLRHNGVLSELSPGWAPAAMPSPCLDNCLYEVGKAALSATLQRAADSSGDPSLAALAQSVIDRALDQTANSLLPLGKASGEIFARLSSAIARKTNTNPPEEFRNGFEAN